MDCEFCKEINKEEMIIWGKIGLNNLKLLKEEGKSQGRFQIYKTEEDEIHR